MNINELPIEKALEELNELNLKNNFIDFIQEGIQFNDEPKFPTYAGKIGDFTKKSDACSCEDEYCSGLSSNPILAKLITYAEGIERFSMSYYRLSEMKLSSYNDLDENKLNPNTFIKSKFLLKKDFRNTKFYWKEVESFFDKKKVYVPSQFIYVPFEKDEEYVRLPISTGCAAGSTSDMATLRGILECLERHDFITMYLNKISPMKIIFDNSKESKEINNLVQYFKKYKLKANIFKINNNDEYHTILTILEDESNFEFTPHLSFGCSSDINIFSAIEKSIYEAQKSRIWIRQEIILKPKIFNQFKEKKNFNSMVERGFFWSHRENKKYLNFIFEANKNYKIYDFKGCYKNLLDYLKNNNYDIYVAKLTPDFLKKSNIHINKVIIPRLQPLYLHENFKYDIGENINKEINDIPHPFL